MTLAGISVHPSSPLGFSILISRLNRVHLTPNNVLSLPRNRNRSLSARCLIHPLCNLVFLCLVLGHHPPSRTRIIRYYLQQQTQDCPLGHHLPFIFLAPLQLRGKHKAMSLRCFLQVLRIVLHVHYLPRSHGQNLCHLRHATRHRSNHRPPHDQLF